MLAVALGLLAITGLVFPILWGESWPDGAGSTSLAAVAREPAVRQVDVVLPVRGGVRRMTIQPGTVHAFESVNLYAKASGFLRAQTVDIGSPVTRGQLLIEIDAPELQGDIAEAAAAVDQAKAQAEQAESRIATAEAERDAEASAVLQAESEVARSIARQTLSGKQYERIKGLYSRNAVERELVDEHQHDVDATVATVQAGQAALSTAHARVATADAKVRQAKADAATAKAAIRVADAKLARAKVLASYTRVVAPFDGVVTRRTFHPGAFIRSAADGSSAPLLSIMRTDRMRVEIQVPDLDVPLLDVGDKVTFEVNALKGREFTGVVARMGKAEDTSTRTMKTEVDLENIDRKLVEGMYGRASIELQPRTDNLTIPAACVVGHAERGKAALFVVRGGKARRTPVTLGGDDGASVEVLSGLGPDDKVVARPGGTLDDGADVHDTSVSPKGVAKR